MAGVSGSSLGNMSDQAATSFTHHLYHHFDRTADRAGMFFPYLFFQQIYSSWAELDLFQSALQSSYQSVPTFITIRVDVII